MRHGVPEIEMNDNCFHAESTVANLDPLNSRIDLFRMPVSLLR